MRVLGRPPARRARQTLFSTSATDARRARGRSKFRRKCIGRTVHTHSPQLGTVFDRNIFGWPQSVPTHDCSTPVTFQQKLWCPTHELRCLAAKDAGIKGVHHPGRQASIDAAAHVSSLSLCNPQPRTAGSVGTGNAPQSTVLPRHVANLGGVSLKPHAFLKIR